MSAGAFFIGIGLLIFLGGLGAAVLFLADRKTKGGGRAMTRYREPRRNSAVAKGRPA